MCGWHRARVLKPSRTRDELTAAGQPTSYRSRLGLRGSLRAVAVLLLCSAYPADANDARLRAQPQNLDEQILHRRRVTLAKPGKRAVVGRGVASQNPVGNALDAEPLQLTARPLATAVAVEQNRKHHRRMVGLAALAVVLLGLWPAPVVDVMHASIENLLQHVAVSKL